MLSPQAANTTSSFPEHFSRVGPGTCVFLRGLGPAALHFLTSPKLLICEIPLSLVSSRRPQLCPSPQRCPTFGHQTHYFLLCFQSQGKDRRSHLNRLLHTFPFPTSHYQGGRKKFSQAKTNPVLLGGPLRASMNETLGDKDHETE